MIFNYSSSSSETELIYTGEIDLGYSNQITIDGTIYDQDQNRLSNQLVSLLYIATDSVPMGTTIRAIEQGKFTIKNAPDINTFKGMFILTATGKDYNSGKQIYEMLKYQDLTTQNLYLPIDGVVKKVFHLKPIDPECSLTFIIKIANGGFPSGNNVHVALQRENDFQQTHTAFHSSSLDNNYTYDETTGRFTSKGYLAGGNYKTMIINTLNPIQTFNQSDITLISGVNDLGEITLK